MPNRWIYRSETPFERAGEFAAELGVSPLVVDILRARGLASLEEMDRFLSPGLRHLPDPGAVSGLTRAAEVLARELAAGKTPAIWGDYDVDGVTATALLLDFFAGRGITALRHLPRRSEEGYGLNTAGVEALAGQGAGVLLTVDCGISDIEPVARAKELGMAVVVTDHHLPGGTLPDADAVADPRLEDGCGPCADLAGVGVAFFLAAALNRLLPGEPVDIRNFLDLVALGTVADVVPLTGVNRILVKNGLLLIRDANRPGIAALKEASGFDRFADLGAGNIAFGLAPRINAAGRLDDPAAALDMLLAPDVETALPLARKLDKLNSERRAEEQSILDEALEQAEAQVAIRDEGPDGGRYGRVGLVLCGEHWHPGVIGIVASRVVEKHYRPTLLLCARDGLLKGSGRSIEEFDLHAGLSGVSDLLESFGGHRQAAGMSLVPENLEPLRRAFDRVVRAELGDKPLVPRLNVDRKLSLDQVDFTLVKEMALLAPFGMGNPEPVFASPRLVVKERRVFGKNHVRLALRDERAGVTLTGKAWRMAEHMGPDLKGRTVRVAYCPRLDDWDGIPKMELTIRDWNLVDTG